MILLIFYPPPTVNGHQAGDVSQGSDAINSTTQQWRKEISAPSISREGVGCQCRRGFERDAVYIREKKSRCRTVDFMVRIIFTFLIRKVWGLSVVYERWIRWRSHHPRLGWCYYIFDGKIFLRRGTKWLRWCVLCWLYLPSWRMRSSGSSTIKLWV